MQKFCQKISLKCIYENGLQQKCMKSLLLLLSFLDPDRDRGHQQCQLSIELLTGPVVSDQAKFYLDACTPIPQFVSMSQ